MSDKRINRPYRGKKAHPKEWVYGYLIGDDVIVGNIVEFNDEYFNTAFWYRVDPETVGQYTGIKDLNGKEIYDGDIIDAKDEGFPFTKSMKGVVKMIDGSWLIENFEGTDGEYLFEELRADRVIGNIYEHPHLLTGGTSDE